MIKIIDKIVMIEKNIETTLVMAKKSETTMYNEINKVCFTKYNIRNIMYLQNF